MRNKDRRALIRRRFDFQRGADQRGSLLHADQSEAGAVPAFGDVEPDSIVLDDQQDAVGAAFENHLDLPGVRVFRDVVERFLRDPVERRFHFG